MIGAQPIVRNLDGDGNNPAGDTERDLYGDTEKCDKIATKYNTLGQKFYARVSQKGTEFPSTHFQKIPPDQY